VKVYRKIIDRVSGFNVNIPFDGKVVLMVKKGDNVRPGTILFRRVYKKIKSAYFLPRELGVTVKMADDYIVRIDGEYVTKGEILAEKLSAGGLVLKKIVALDDGILSLDRIGSGYLDILTEDIEVEYRFEGYGKVVSIDFGHGIVISCSAWVMPVKFALGRKSRIEFKNSVEGVFTTVCNGDSVYTFKDLKSSYTNEIVFAGRFLYPEVLREIYGRGGDLVLSHSCDFDMFSKSEIEVGITGGFGQISYPEEYLRIFKSMEGKQCYVDLNKGLIAWADTGQYIRKSVTEPVNTVESGIKRGMWVKILDQESFGAVGKVESITEEGYCTIDIDQIGKILIHTSSLQAVML